MSSIFCLETEWDQSVHDMKKESSARPLLQYLATVGVEFVFRQVATLSEFEYYLKHLDLDSAYQSILYLKNAGVDYFQWPMTSDFGGYPFIFEL